MYKEYSKISVHNHFGGAKAEYCYAEPVSATKFFDLTAAKNKIDSAASNEFQLLGFTNHNHFWKNEYDELCKYIKNKKYDINLIPGVELDLKNELTDCKRLHGVLLVSKACDLSKFEIDISTLVSSNGQNAITIDQLVDLCLNRKCILILHGNKQKPRDAITNLDVFEDIIGARNYIPILIENSTNAKKDFLISKLKSRLSDADYEWLDDSASVSSADQSDFSEIREPTYIWAPPTFDALFYCSIIGSERFFREEDIIQKNKAIGKLVIKNKGGEMQGATILFSHGLNTIVGNSGSGKTLLLNLINKLLIGDNLKNSISSSTSNYEKIYKNSDFEIYDLNGNEILQYTISVFEGESLYKQVVKTLNLNKAEMLKEFGVTPNFKSLTDVIYSFNESIDNYLKNRKKAVECNNSISKSIMNYFSEADFLNNSNLINNIVEYTIDQNLKNELTDLESKIEDAKNDIIAIDEHLKEISRIIKKYSIKSEDLNIDKLTKSILITILRKKNEIEKKRIGVKAKLMRSEYIYKVVSRYNERVGERALTINKAKQNIAIDASNIINQLKTYALLEKDKKIPVLKLDQCVESLTRDNNFAFVKLDNFTINYYIEYDKLVDYFESSIGSSAWKLNKSIFSSFKDSPLSLCLDSSMVEFLDIFISNNYTNQVKFSFIDDGVFLKYDTFLEKTHGNYQPVESLSAGELSKIYINVLIDKKLDEKSNSAIILYDQPDNNLEKAFILESLVTKLCELKRKYQIIITTHEPLLVVNADSNAIIKATNNPTAGRNKICYENISLYESSNKNDAIDKVAKIIDGDKRAVRLRDKIYGGIDLW